MHPLSLLFPKSCVGCGRIGSYICASCRSKIEYLGQSDTICPVCRKPAFSGLIHPYCRGRGKADGFWAFFRYQGVVKKAIKSVKFRYASDIISEIIGLIPLTSYNNIREWPGFNSAIITPIPLSKIRLRDRGFNQAELVCRSFAKKIGLEAKGDVLTRARDKAPQTEQRTREKRLNNVKGVFKVQNNAIISVRNKTIIVVDDVSTTGATLNEAAKTLKVAGAKTVYEVSLAR